MKALIILSVWIFSVLPVRAEMTAITVAATIQSFDSNSVIIRVGEKTVNIPRGLVKEKTFRVGDALLLTFQGAEIKYLFAHQMPADRNRRPASEKK